MKYEYNGVQVSRFEFLGYAHGQEEWAYDEVRRTRGLGTSSIHGLYNTSWGSMFWLTEPGARFYLLRHKSNEHQVYGSIINMMYLPTIDL